MTICREEPEEEPKALKPALKKHAAWSVNPDDATYTTLTDVTLPPGPQPAPARFGVQAPRIGQTRPASPDRWPARDAPRR
jgi:hypothetical protein